MQSILGMEHTEYASDEKLRKVQGQIRAGVRGYIIHPRTVRSALIRIACGKSNTTVH